jgi:hypothetical protein
MMQMLTQMQQDARRLAPLVRRVKEYEELQKDEIANVHRLEKALPHIRQQINLLTESDRKAKLLEWCGEQDARVRSLKDDFRYRFGGDLKAALAEHGLPLEGQFPLLHAGFYTTKVDFEAGYARIYWGPEVEVIRSRLALSAADVANAIVSFDQQLKHRGFQASVFVRQLNAAYERNLQASGRPAASRVLITEIMGEVAFQIQPKKFAVNPVRENFQDYSRVQFGYDLYRLKQSGEQVSGGKVLRLFVATFDSTTEKSKSLWVPDSEQGTGTYYSYLSFEVQRHDEESPKPEVQNSDRLQTNPAPTTDLGFDD